MEFDWILHSLLLVVAFLATGVFVHKENTSTVLVKALLMLPIMLLVRYGVYKLVGV
jgi:hypothetical protein